MGWVFLFFVGEGEMDGRVFFRIVFLSCRYDLFVGYKNLFCGLNLVFEKKEESISVSYKVGVDFFGDTLFLDVCVLSVNV